MAAAAHAQEKPKAKEKRLTNKNVKWVYEELDDVDELLQDVLNERSSATNGYALSCKRFLPRPRASDSAIVYEYVTHTCTCVDKRHDVRKGGAVWFSINRSRTLLPLMCSWCYYGDNEICTANCSHLIQPIRAQRCMILSCDMSTCSKWMYSIDRIEMKTK